MEIATDHEVEGITGDCGGVCSCSTCHVFIPPEWQSQVGTAEETESDTLEFNEHRKANSRLGCQVEMTEALDGLVVSCETQPDGTPCASPPEESTAPPVDTAEADDGSRKPGYSPGHPIIHSRRRRFSSANGKTEQYVNHSRMKTMQYINQKNPAKRWMRAALAGGAFFALPLASSAQTFSTEALTASGNNVRTDNVISTQFAWAVGGGSDEATPDTTGSTGVTISWADSQPTDISADFGSGGGQGTSTDREAFEGQDFTDPFQEVIDDYGFTDTDDNISISLSNLTVGENYRFQAIAARETGNDAGQRLVLGTNQADPGIDYNFLTPGSALPNGDGGGALVIANFEANSTSQDITIFETGGGRTILNGAVLQTVPEPAAAGAAVGAVALLAALGRRRRRG